MLICIPDISGFTKFMSETDAELSAKVIPSLLNEIIYSNDIGLKVSEIEGDAVLFFRQHTIPTAKELMDQCAKFYLNFYAKLKTLNHQFENLEHTEKFTEALGLKIICHLGSNIEAVTIGKHIKLMGEDVITAHRLLKNNVKSNDYILLSKTIYDTYTNEELKRAVYWTDTISEDFYTYKHIGKKFYKHIDLKSLRINKAI